MQRARRGQRPWSFLETQPEGSECEGLGEEKRGFSGGGSFVPLIGGRKKNVPPSQVTPGAGTKTGVDSPEPTSACLASPVLLGRSRGEGDKDS